MEQDRASPVLSFRAQEQERAVLGDARRLGLDALYKLPPLPVGAPDDPGVSGVSAAGAENGGGEAGPA